LSLSIKGSDKKINLDRYNVWVNEVPVFGRTGKSVRNQKTKSISATVELTLSEGMNRIEVSVMNMAGTESYRMPLYVNYSPAVKQKEMTRFIGIGIDQFKQSNY
ncbi:MAG TPA: hypothetical protein PK977_18270, partial [Chitinophagaceae bacterium]|nr:hypothetical protein [Chitinophagaceae bacterium]